MFLFRVEFDVATAATRPPLWQPQSGWCMFYLFANDHNDAVDRAKAILEALPFVLVDTKARVSNYDEPRLSADDRDTAEHDPADSLKAITRYMEANARLTGLAFAFMPIGHAQQVADSRVIKFLIDPSIKRSTPPS